MTTTETFANKIVQGDIKSLSQAITLVESNKPEHQEKANTIVNYCLPYSNKSIRIGVTGVPGVGKSTFIDALGQHLLTLDKKVAVLAVDPSSVIRRGSILGDKTRMEVLSKHPNAFIRPSPSGTNLGGVAKKTRETISLCEAAGFDITLIETVGVGQSEITVHSMVDFFLLLKLPGAGDELQGIKRGIIEMADAIVINKADGEFTKHAISAQIKFSNTIQLLPNKESQWRPQVTLCSALHKEGIAAIWDSIESYIKLTTTNGYFSTKRQSQNKQWLLQSIEDLLISNFYKHKEVQQELEKQLVLINDYKTTTFMAAKKITKLL